MTVMTAAVAGISSGVQSILAQFSGDPYTPQDSQVSPTPAVATFTVQTSGDILENVTDAGDWVSNKTGLSSSDFEARMTYVSGDTVDSGTVGSWVTISSDLVWSMQRAITGTNSGVYTLEIREIANTSNIDSTTVTFTAEVAVA